MTLAAARQNEFKYFVLGDALGPLAGLWQQIISNPEPIAVEYADLYWRERAAPIDAYYEIRSEFNLCRSPAKLLYLLARCVKNAVRFNPSGAFNQSPDKRRKGTHPDTMKSELFAAHNILKGRAECRCSDFNELLAEARETDLVYMDPPYQGTSDGRDQRYVQGVKRETVVAALESLNRRGIQFILSYDGSLGDKSYGPALPTTLAYQLLLDVGRSSQATLNGSTDATIESLYMSHGLVDEGKPTAMALRDFSSQFALFA